VLITLHAQSKRLQLKGDSAAQDAAETPKHKLLYLFPLINLIRIRKKRINKKLCPKNIQPDVFYIGHTQLDSKTII
jgi:hypothetical protein